MWHLNAVYAVPFGICYPQPVLSHITCTTDWNRLVSPHALYISLQKAILNACRAVGSAWSVGLYCFENRLNCCEVGKVDYDNHHPNTSQPFTDPFRPCLRVSSKVFEVVFVHLTYSASLFFRIQLLFNSGWWYPIKIRNQRSVGYGTVNPSAWNDGHCPLAARSHSFVYISTS